MYSAVVLTPESATRLKSILVLSYDFHGFVFRTDRYDLPHHLTIGVGFFDPKLNSEEIIGKHAHLYIGNASVNQHMGICAVSINKAVCVVKEKEVEIRSSNLHPHITCALKPGVKPFLSNRMLEIADFATENIRLEQPCILEGIVQANID
jgi:hypothetical protein